MVTKAQLLLEIKRLKRAHKKALEREYERGWNDCMRRKEDIKNWPPHQT